MSKKKKILLGGLILGAILLASLYSIFGDLPNIQSLPQHLNQPSIRITDRNGRPLYEILPETGLEFSNGYHGIWGGRVL